MQRGIYLSYCLSIFYKQRPLVSKTHFFSKLVVGNHRVTWKPFNQLKKVFSFGTSMKICFKNTAKPQQNQKKLKYEQVYCKVVVFVVIGKCLFCAVFCNATVCCKKERWQNSCFEKSSFCARLLA